HEIKVSLLGIDTLECLDRRLRHRSLCLVHLVHAIKHQQALSVQIARKEICWQLQPGVAFRPQCRDIRLQGGAVWLTFGPLAPAHEISQGNQDGNRRTVEKTRPENASKFLLLVAEVTFASP